MLAGESLQKLWDFQEHVGRRVKRILLSTGRNQKQKMQEIRGWNWLNLAGLCSLHWVPWKFGDDKLS